MTKHNDPPSIRDRLIDEIIDEIASLDANDLDAFLRDLGEDPAKGLEAGNAIRNGAIAKGKLARLRAAQQTIKTKTTPNATAILAFDPERKRQIFDRIKQRSETSGDMTLAARNRRIDSDKDLDSFLEACLRLGLIDETGELID